MILQTEGLLFTILVHKSPNPYILARYARPLNMNSNEVSPYFFKNIWWFCNWPQTFYRVGSAKITFKNFSTVLISNTVCFSSLATWRWGDFNSQNPLLAGEFWMLKSTQLQVAKLEKRCCNRTFYCCPHSPVVFCTIRNHVWQKLHERKGQAHQIYLLPKTGQSHHSDRSTISQPDSSRSRFSTFPFDERGKHV